MNRFNEYINNNYYLLILIAVIVFLLFLAVLILVITRKRRRNHEPEDLYAEMEGTEFEAYCAKLLQANGFTEIEMTPATADFGVDIFAEKDASVRVVFHQDFTEAGRNSHSSFGIQTYFNMS